MLLGMYQFLKRIIYCIQIIEWIKLLMNANK